MAFVTALAATAVATPMGSTAAAQRTQPVSLVDPFIGTDGNGHTFPGASVPFGMVQFSPVSVGGGVGGYRYSETRLRGFSLTRLSGAGCSNYGDVPLWPALRAPRSSPAREPALYSDSFVHRDEVAEPGSYEVRLSSGISVALTATTRTGFGVFTYPGTTSAGTLLIDPSGSANHETATIRVLGRNEVVGSTTSAAFAGACGHPPGNYTLYFVLEFQQPFTRFGTWSGGRFLPGGSDQAGGQVGAFVSFDTRNGASVRVKVGLSYVSVENALANLAVEATSWSFSRVQARAQATWDQLLQRVRVSGGSRDAQTVFYTALYHSLLHPNVFSDANGQYIGADGRVHSAAGYTRYANFSGWDIYRGEVQLLSLLAPQQTSDMIQSLIASGQETGQLPKWPVANAETQLMIGDPSDPIIADAYAFGARGFDTKLALAEMLNGAGVSPQAQAETAPATAYTERPGLSADLSDGYVPGAASTTLEYSIADFAISQFASALGDQADSQTLLGRSGNWKQVFNPETGFVEPRLANGSFPANFDPTSMTGFVEGDGYQYSLMVPQDMSELLADLGQPAAVIQRLDAFFARLNAGPQSAHAWLGNEPSFFSPYAYLWLAAPWRSEEVVRRAVTTLFGARPDGLPGNDDLGALSSWLVWSALGLFPAIPGVPGLAIVSPLFPSAAITLPSGATVQITAANAGSTNRYVQGLLINGAVYDASWLPLVEIAAGARLDVVLGSNPSSWATATSSLPPSFTVGSAPGPAGAGR